MFSTLPLLTALALSALLTLSVVYFFPRWGLMDKPQLYGHQRKPIPHMAGAAPLLAFVITAVMMLELDTKLITLLAVVMVLAIVSFLDDKYNLSPLIRLPLHIACAIAVAFAGVQITAMTNPLGGSDWQMIGMIPIFITVIWLVGSANVMNWLDGVAGLSAGSAMIAACFIGILSLAPHVDQPELALLSFLVAAALAPFLLFNLAPPRMLFGDTGAVPFGFLVATLAVFQGGKLATAFIVLALPIADAIWVVLQRFWYGKNPLRGADGLHLHDKLMSLGIGQREILLIYLTLSTLLGYLALQLQTLGKIILIVSFFMSFLVFSLVLEKIARKNF